MRKRRLGEVASLRWWRVKVKMGSGGLEEEEEEVNEVNELNEVNEAEEEAKLRW